MRHIGEKMILLLCIAVFGIAAVKLIDIGKEAMQNDAAA